MKSLKTRISLLVLLTSFVAAAPLAAFDFGLLITNSSSVDISNSWEFTQSNRALAWMNIPIGEEAALYLSAYYRFKGVFDESSTQLVPYLFNVDRFEAAGTAYGLFGKQTTLRYNIGRIMLGDFSGRLINGLNDGVRLNLDMGNTAVTIFGAYRGLLFSEDAKSMLPKTNQAFEDSLGITLAPPSLVAGASLRVNELIPLHDMGLEFWMLFDLDDAGGRTDFQYFEQFIEGRINVNFRWRLWNILGFSSSTPNYFSMASGAYVRYVNPSAMNLRITQSVFWASGETAPFSSFTAIQHDVLAGDSLFVFSDLIAPVTEISFFPLRVLSMQAGARVLLRTTDADPGVSGATLRSGSNALYMGLEPFLGMNLNPFSDFSLALSGACFIPETSSAFVADTPILWKASLFFSLSL